MAALSGATRQVLLFSLIFLGITISFCLLRGILGPRFTDRVVAVNMIGTKTILLIAALSLFLGESYLLDVCLIYALISFLSVVVMTRTYLSIFNRKRAGQNGAPLPAGDGGAPAGDSGIPAKEGGLPAGDGGGGDGR